MLEGEDGKLSPTNAVSMATGMEALPNEELDQHLSKIKYYYIKV